MKRLPISFSSILLSAVFFALGTSCTKPQEINSLTREISAPSWSRNAVIYEVNVRQFSDAGTIAAVEAELPRLKEMGIDILWLMPIHPIGELNRKGSLGSHYAVKDYLGFNPDYGTLEDFKKFVAAAHENGMKVIIDWVANHTAWDNALVTEHPDWFTKNEKGEMIPPVADWADVVDLDFSNPELRRYMIDALKFWVRDYDIDGYRCDVAGMVPADFWVDARKELDAIKPVFMLAEAEEGIHQQAAFDMSYGWKVHHAFNQIAKGLDHPAKIDSMLSVYESTFPKGYNVMLFTSNHDENSWNGTEFERLGAATDVFAVLAATLPGMPLVYNGQESAMDKRLAFFEKDPIAWGTYSKSGFYKTLFDLKHRNPALAHGESVGAMGRIGFANDATLYSFYRKSGENVVVVFTNLAGAQRFCSLGNRELNGTFKNVFTGEVHELKGTFEANLDAWGWVVLEKVK